MLRLDGFVSADFDAVAGGTLTTPALRFQGGSTLGLNLDTSAGGVGRVEVLDEQGFPIPGYSLRESDDLNVNSVRVRASWRGGKVDVSPLAGRAIPAAVPDAVGAAVRLPVPVGASGRRRAGFKGAMKNPRTRGLAEYGISVVPEKDLGPGSAGQSGDTQGLSNVAEATNESVVELLEEGQAFEAEVVAGIEGAEEPDQISELQPVEVPEDDVPPEYQQRPD